MSCGAAGAAAVAQLEACELLVGEYQKAAKD